MNKEILVAIETVCNEKSLDMEDIIMAIEAAFAAVVRRDNGNNIDVCVVMDRETGACEAFRRWLVMDDEDPEFTLPDEQVLFTQAQERKPGVKVGEYLYSPMSIGSFGRIAAHTAKQVIVQKMREAERGRVAEIYRDKVGSLVMGIVKREERSGVFVDLGDNAEGFIAREQLIPREGFRPGDRTRAYLKEISEDHFGLQLVLSRTAPEFLVELVKLEVPEIGQGLIEVRGASRDPGMRAKIAVLSNDLRLDPIGACVGMRGSRVQSVSNELAGERIDIILWDENPAQYVINAMSPTTVVSIVVDEDNHSMNVAVEESKLSQAIGRGGQNIKLASQLTGWELNVMTENQADEKSEQEVKELQSLFMEKLAVDEEVAAILVQEGFSSIEEIVYVPIEELSRIEEFDGNIVEELRERASNVLLTAAIGSEGADEVETIKSLLEIEGIDDELERKLATIAVHTVADLAEQGVGDLMEIEGMDQEKAAGLIMAARAPWFDKPAEDTDTEEQEQGKEKVQAQEQAAAVSTEPSATVTVKEKAKEQEQAAAVSTESNATVTVKEKAKVQAAAVSTESSATVTVKEKAKEQEQAAAVSTEPSATVTVKEKAKEQAAAVSTEPSATVTVKEKAKVQEQEQEQVKEKVQAQEQAAAVSTEPNATVTVKEKAKGQEQEQEQEHGQEQEQKQEQER